MYAIFETGGKQYKVAAGDVIRVEKLPETEGKIVFDKVLAVNDGKSTQIGTPYLDAATLNATVTKTGKGDKVIVYKFKAKKDYRRKQGHRQPFTEVFIESVIIGSKTIFKAEIPKDTEKPGANKDESTEKAQDAVVADKIEEKSIKDSSKDSSETDKIEETSAALDTATDDVAEDNNKVDEEAPAAAKTDSKLKKADIMAKLDELGAEYSKSAKKDELLDILAEAENK